MARQKKAYATKTVQIVFPKVVDDAMRVALFSDSRGRIPGGAISEFVVTAVKRELRRINSVNLDDLLENTNGE